MTRPAPLTVFADVMREMPATAAARLDRAAAAVASLRHEQRRLEQIGFERPLARCHDQLRFWQFVHALHALATPAVDASRFDLEADPWRPVHDR